MEETFITIPIARGEDPLIYRSHLVLSQEQFDSMSIEDILLAIDNQYNNWLSIINTPIDLRAEYTPIDLGAEEYTPIDLDAEYTPIDLDAEYTPKDKEVEQWLL